MIPKPLSLILLIMLVISPAFAEDYLIGAEDELKISVWETPGLDLEVTVLPDGKITYPLVGDITAAGLTITQLRENLTERLVKYIKDPIVTVLITKVRSYKVYIQGEVKQPGTYILRKKTTVLELLADAGGLNQNADAQRVYLLRKDKTTTLNFYQLLEKGNVGENVLLIPGDIIIVPSNFTNRITVVGEVKKPQIISYQEGMTVLDAILMVDGFTTRADLDDTLVIRKNGAANEKIEIDMKAVIKKGTIEQNILLKPGDTIIVSESLI